jgi:hypothetical protein
MRVNRDIWSLRCFRLTIVFVRTSSAITKSRCTLEDMVGEACKNRECVSVRVTKDRVWIALSSFSKGQTKTTSLRYTRHLS